MLCRKDISIYRLFTSFYLFAVFPCTLLAQVEPVKTNDTSFILAEKKMFLRSLLQIEKPLYNRSILRSNSQRYNDTLKKNIMVPLQALKLSDQLSGYNNALKTIAANINKDLASPFSITNGSANISGVSTNINNDSLQQQNYNLFDAAIGGTILGIPFNGIYQNHYYPFIGNRNQNRMSFRYDRASYMESIKKKLDGKFDPKKLLEAAGDPVQMLKATATKALQNDLAKIKDQYKGLLDDKVSQLGNLDDIFSKDINAISKSLLNNKWLERLEIQSSVLAQLQTQINNGQQADRKQYDSLINEFEKYKGAKALLQTLQSHNKKWEESGLLKRIRESGLLKKDMLNKIINDPATIRKIAKEKLDLNSLQRLFLSVTKLNIGQTTTDFSRFLTGTNIMHGINTGFLLNNKKSVDASLGELRIFNSVLDMPFANSLFNSNRMIGLHLQNGSMGGLSLLSFQTFSGNTFPFSTPSLPRQSMVIGINRQFEINKTNNIQVELSKSSGYYKNDLANDGSGGSHNVSDIFSTQDFAKSLAASVNYVGEFEKIEMQAETFLKYTGTHYDNPATSFVPAGTREAGTSFRKMFFAKKLQLYTRTNCRLYQFSTTANRKWSSYNHFIDIKWRMKKGQSFALRYQPVRSFRIENKSRFINTSTDRVSATANIAARLKAIQYRNYFTIAYQDNSYNYQNSGNVSNRALQISAMQNFVIGKNVFFSNTSFNKVNSSSAFIFFNTSFNTDLGITYTIGKNITASSSINYNSIEGWYQQVGIKQSLAGELGKKITMDIYIDIGKNIRTFQPLPYSLFRAEWSLQYLFNR